MDFKLNKFDRKYLSLHYTRKYTRTDRITRSSFVFNDNCTIPSGYWNLSSFLMIWSKKDLNLICLGLRNRNCLRQVWILWIPYYKKHFKLSSQFGWFFKNYSTQNNSKNIFENLNVSAFHWYQLRECRLSIKVGTLILSWKC